MYTLSVFWAVIQNVHARNMTGMRVHPPADMPYLGSTLQLLQFISRARVLSYRLPFIF